MKKHWPFPSGAALQLSLLTLFLATLSGCDLQTRQQQVVNVELQMADGDRFRQLLQQHQGKVVLVDYWATW